MILAVAESARELKISFTAFVRTSFSLLLFRSESFV
nr:MAG TPA: hypothetical protein [Caudoviricetes sp.]